MPDPPPNLQPEQFAANLYDALAPLTRPDPEVGWSLLILCNAIGQMFQLVSDWVRDTPAGPGWSPLLDLDRCPPEAVRWLAQFVGVRPYPSLTDAQQREMVRQTVGFRRGTPAAMIRATQTTLIDTKRVTLIERNGDPYFLTVQTVTAETPNAARTLRAATSQKPAGIILTMGATVYGQTYAKVKADWATYAAAKTAYVNYNAMLLDVRS